MTARTMLTSLFHRLPSRAWAWLGGFSVIGLLSYPLPLAWLGLGGLVGLAIARWRRFGSPFPGSPLAIPLTLYLAGAVLGWSITLAGLDRADLRLFGLLAALLAFALVVHLATSPTAAQRVTIGLLLLALIASGPVLLLSIPVLQTERLPAPLAAWMSALETLVEPLRRMVLEADGLASERYRLTAAGVGTLAGYGIALALGPLIAGSDRGTRRLAVAGLVGLAPILLLSTNRISLLSVALVALLLGALRYRWLLGGALLIGAYTVWAVFGLTGGGSIAAASPALATDASNFFVRLEYWQNALYLLGDFRYSGIGLGGSSVRAVYQSYFLSGQVRFLPDGTVDLRDDFRFQHAHNMFVQSYLEQGLAGLAGLVLLVAVALAIGARALARLRDPTARSVAISAAGAGLVLLLTGLTEIVALSPLGMVLLFSALALLVAADRLARRPTGARAMRTPLLQRRPGGVPVWAVASTLLAAPIALYVVAPPREAPSTAVLAAADGSLRGVVAAFYRNVGALEVAKATLSSATPHDDERDLRLTVAEGFLALAGLAAPDDPAADHQLAAAALARSQRPAALRRLTAAETKTAPGDSRSFFQLGRLYRAGGYIDRALAAWTRVDPMLGRWTGTGVHAQVYVWGLDLARRGRWEDAIKVNRAAIQPDPLFPVPYAALAMALSRHQGDAAALAAMEDLAETYPRVPWPYLEMASVYRRGGQTERARAAEQRAEELRASLGSTVKYTPAQWFGSSN